MNSGAIAHKHGCQPEAPRKDSSYNQLEAPKRGAPHMEPWCWWVAAPQSSSVLDLGGQHLLFHLFHGHGALEDSDHGQEGRIDCQHMLMTSGSVKAPCCWLPLVLNSTKLVWRLGVSLIKRTERMAIPGECGILIVIRNGDFVFHLSVPSSFTKESILKLRL